MYETIAQIEKAMAEFTAEIETVKEQRHGWKAAAFRARRHSQTLGKLMLQFRKDSVAAAKQ